jgi:hypothetical protein
MGWLAIEVKIVRKRGFGNKMRFATTNLEFNMESNLTEELIYFGARVTDHLVKKRKYKPENVSICFE